MSITKLLANNFSRYFDKNFVFALKDYHSSPLICIRKAHTDIKVPDFSKYMIETVQDPSTKSAKTEHERKNKTTLIFATFGILGLYGTKAEVHRYVLFMAPSADVLALAKIEINLAEIPEGKCVTFKWRGKPLFIRHRSPEQITSSEIVPLSSLRDPAEDSERCPRKEFLVVIGVCTHLGCVPVCDAGDYGPGGYYCPCHGSHFDASGRIRKGPAPTNLEIPEHKFLDDGSLVVG